MELVAGYPLRRSGRARRITVKVPATGEVEVVAPLRASQREIERFVRSEQDWIDRALRRLEPQLRTVRARRLVHGGQLPYLGVPYTLSFGGRPAARPRVSRGRSAITVVGAPHEEADRRALLERWFRREARAHFEELIEERAHAHGLSPGRLQIRDQATRWGSCSPSGDICLNWRLMLAPEEVGLYVVEHELAHIDVPNHSRRFWSLLASRMPGYEAPRRWLRRNGATLRF
jgi:predicted metal-dependent hydrolase